MKMQCPRCHNEDNTYLYRYHNEYYCRKCIAFSRVNIHDVHITKRLHYEPKNVLFNLDFQLSPRQQDISHELLNHYQNGKNSYVWAVCGSGKTEVVFEVIQYALNQGHRVCFCIPRKELVKELYERIQSSFQNIDIGLLYGGCEKRKEAQFIICTMHQLYKFENDIGFDLMISDEVDAFPFYQNDVLQEIFARCCLGNFIKLSATFKKEDIIDGELLIMNRRYHGVHLPVPCPILCPKWIQKWLLLLMVLKMKRKWIIYVPTIQQVEDVSKFLKRFCPRVQGISSKTRDAQKYINQLKIYPYYILVSTTLLERGITVENVHVIIYQCEHTIFDERTLIQIAGRVGRKPKYPTGDIYFLTAHQTKDIQKCIKTIKSLNKMNV